MNFYGHNARVQHDVVAPHSATAAHRTVRALSSGAACVSPAATYVSQAGARVSPLDARHTASLALSQPRVAVPESETAEHENQDGRRSDIYFSWHNAGVKQDAVAPHSNTAAQTAPALAPRAARCDPLVAWPVGLGHSRATATANETAEQDFLPGLRGLRMDGISEVAPVLEVCWTLWRPTPPLQHPTGPPQF